MNELLIPNIKQILKEAIFDPHEKIIQRWILAYKNFSLFIKQNHIFKNQEKIKLT